MSVRSGPPPMYHVGHRASCQRPSVRVLSVPWSTVRRPSQAASRTYASTMPDIVRGGRPRRCACVCVAPIASHMRPRCGYGISGREAADAPMCVSHRAVGWENDLHPSPFSTFGGWGRYGGGGGFGERRFREWEERKRMSGQLGSTSIRAGLCVPRLAGNSLLCP